MRVRRPEVGSVPNGALVRPVCSASYSVPFMTEKELLEKIRAIEALFAGTTHAGERTAAAEARERLLKRLREVQAADPAVEMRFVVHDPWARQLLRAMLRRYGIQPYRRHGQHRQSVMVKVPRRFMDETLWPQFLEAHQLLAKHISEVAERIIREAVGDPGEEREEVSLADRRSLPESA